MGREVAHGRVLGVNTSGPQVKYSTWHLEFVFICLVSQLTNTNFSLSYSSGSQMSPSMTIASFSHHSRRSVKIHGLQPTHRTQMFTPSCGQIPGSLCSTNPNTALVPKIAPTIFFCVTSYIFMPSSPSAL